MTSHPMRVRTRSREKTTSNMAALKIDTFAAKMP